MSTRWPWFRAGSNPQGARYETLQTWPIGWKHERPGGPRQAAPVSESLRAGADRFHGYGDLYDAVRHGVPPSDLADRARLLLRPAAGPRRRSRAAARACPDAVGRGWADDVIGVEPSEDMLATARATPARGSAFRRGWSHDTGLPDGCADVVMAVQALHWMEPAPTFGEVARLLRPGGVFAAIDCDWPPVVGDAVVEQAWDDVPAPASGLRAPCSPRG